MHSKGFLATAVLATAVAALSVVGPTGPATAAPVSGSVTTAPGHIGPGTQMVTAGRVCTANFVFRDGTNRVFVGYAASCATRTAVTGANTCSARSLPAGTTVRFADRGRTVGYGELRYSSLRAMRRAGVTDAATCAANDFALVLVRGAARRKVVPTMPYWGGPSGLGSLPSVGTTVFGLSRASTAARMLPRAGAVTVGGVRSITVSTPLPSTRAARGSGFLDGAGRAVGILTTSTASGENTVVSLARAVSYARSHGVTGLRVVRGRDAFTGSAIL